MSNQCIRRAETDEDFDAARALSRSWAEWQLKTFPEWRREILWAFDPQTYARTVADLHLIHARPKGAILLAELGGLAVGCVMYEEMEPGVAEIKRLFVDEPGRGRGFGRALLETMFAAMRGDGYATVRFSSARFLTHARKLYEGVGFLDIPHPPGFPEKAKEFVYFMEQPL